MGSSHIAPIALLALLLVLPSGPLLHVAASSGGSGDYQHPYPTDIRPGDIVIGHSPLTDPFIPGYWTHTGIVAYYDSSIGDWIVVEAKGSGVVLTPLREFMARYDAFAVLRVSTSDSVREKAVQFALERVGYPYDYWWPSKQVYGDSYYCSELVWAAYKASGGPDIDANPGWSWTYAYGVAPQEVYDDSDTYIVYYHSV